MTAKSNFNGEQLEKLKVWFDINPTPTKDQVDHISAQIKVLSASVWMWFHRQRNRVKTNQDISPSKVKTSVNKGLRSSAPHMHKVKTGSLSKQLDCNGNAEDCWEQQKDAEGNLQDRVRAKKVHIRGILRGPETRQQSGGRNAEECPKQTVKEVERRQHARVKFSDNGEVNTVNKTESIKNLEQERIGGSINRTETRTDPQERIGAEPAQGCSKRKEKVAGSLKQNRVTSFPGYIKNKEKEVDTQTRNTAIPSQQSIKKAVTEADFQRQHRGEIAPVSISRTVKEKEPRNVKPAQESMKEILKEADSQKHVSNKPVQRGMNKTDKAAEPLVQNRLKPAQCCTNSAEKVSKKKPTSLSQSDKDCLLRPDKLAHRVKKNSVPKKIGSNGNIPVNGVHERVKVTQVKGQIGVNSPSASNRVLEEDKLAHRVKNSVPKKIGSDGSIPVNGFHERVKVPQVKGQIVVNSPSAANRVLEEDKLAHRVKNSVPKKIGSNGNIPVNGVHERVKVPQVKGQIGPNSPSAANRVLEEGGSTLKRQIKGHVVKRKVTEDPSSSNVSVHHRAVENNLRGSHQVTDISSLSVHEKKLKHKLSKERRIKRLLSRKSNPSVNMVKSGNVCKETDVSQEKPQSKSEMQANANAFCRKGIFSALSLPQGKTNAYVSDSSDADDFQDDQNTRTHRLSTKKTNKADTLGNGVSIPVISRTRRHEALADCSNRIGAGKNLRRIPLKSWSEVQTKESSVSPVTCEVNSTSTSQSSVISSTVEEVRNPSHSCEGCPESLDSPDSDSCEIAIRITKRSRQGEEKEFVEEVGKRTVPVIIDDKILVPHDTKILFKKELSVNLLKINLSSLSDKREVTASSKMNPSRRDKKKKGGSPPCRDDITDFSRVPKSVERSIWGSFASPVETSNKVWSAIASSGDTPRKEIPFIETPASIDKDLDKFWSSVASSGEMSHKEIPFIERSTLPDGDSTPSSSQDCLESSEGQNRSHKESILDEGSCEVSSSVDLEKTPTVLTENVEETERTSSAVAKKNRDEVEETTADVMKTTQDIQKTPEKSMDIGQTSAGVGENQEEPEKTSADLEESKEEVEETLAEPKKYMDEAEKTSANLVDHLEQLDNTTTESEETLQEANIALVEQTGSRGELEKTAADMMETLGEVHKAPIEEMEKTEISEGKKENETDKEPGSELQDLYEDIDSPDYDIGAPYIVIDEVGCSDTEEFSMESPASKSASLVPLNVVNSPKTVEVVDLDNFSYNDDVIMVSSSAVKQPRNKPPGNKPLKNQSVGNSKQVGQGVACGRTNPTSLKAIKEKDSQEVIDLDYCSEDDEVILLSTLSPRASNSKDVSIKETTELSDRESAKGSPKCLQSKAQVKSVTQETQIEKENVTTPHETLSVGDKLSESQGVSRNTEIKTSDPADKNSSFSISDGDIEIDKSKASSSVHVLQVGEYPKYEVSHKDSPEAALPLQTEVDTGKEHIYEMTEMCLIRNVVSLCSQSVSEEDLACVVPPQLEAGKDGITLEMSCDTIPTCTMSNAIDDPKSPETLNTSEQDAGCTDFTASDELVIDMETCDQIESFLQEKDVLGDTCASTSDAVVVKVDATEESLEHSDSTSDELVRNMEACNQVERPLQETDVQENTTASQSDAAIEKLDTTDQSTGRIDSTSSDELVIDMEACDEIKSPLQDKDVSDSTSASTTQDNVEHDDSFIASDEVNIIITCDRDTTRANAGEDLGTTEELVQSGQDSRHEDSASLDELVIDENACDETQCPLQEKDAPEDDCAPEQNVGCYDSASLDELVIDENACEETQCPLQEKDALEDNCASEQNMGCHDSSSSDELVVDENTCDETMCPLEERDASEQTVGCYDSASSDELVIDENACDEKMCPLEERDAPEQNAGCYDSASSDELFIDENACDETQGPLQEKDASEDKCTYPSDAIEAKLDPLHQNSGPESTVSKELCVNVTTCEQVKCALPENNALGTDNTSSISDAFDRNLDTAEQNVSYEDSTVDVSSCVQIELSLQADAVTEKDASASPSTAVGEKMDPAEQNEAYEDSTSSDERHIYMTPHEEMECPPKVNALLENSIHASLGSSITLKEKALASDVNSSKAVAGVLDQGSLEEGIMTSSGNSPLDKESPGIGCEDVTETELPVPATDSTPSCDVALPHETKAHVDKKGSPPTDAGTTCMELSENLDAEDVTRETGGGEEALTTSDCDMNTTAAPVQTQPNADAAVKSTCTLKNSSPSASGAPSVEPQGISSVAFDPIPSQKEKPSAVQGADVHGASVPNREIIDAANIPVGSTHVPSSETNGVSSVLNAITPSIAAEDLQAQSSLSTDSASHQLPDSNIKSEPDVAAKKDCRSRTNTPSRDPSPSKLDTSTEKVKRPRSLTELVSDLTYRLGALSKAATPATTTRSLDLPYSSVSINRNAHYSTKSASSSTEATPQPLKPMPQSRRGSKRRVITNKNIKRPALSEEVQLRIQQLNPYPCDNTWMRNAAVVELAQREVQLHCQPGESSTKDCALGAHMESSYEPVLGAPGGLNFCCQPEIGSTSGTSRGATYRDSNSAFATSRSANSGNSRVEAQPSSDPTNSGQSTSVITANSGYSTINHSTSTGHSTTVNTANSEQPTTVTKHPHLNHLLQNIKPVIQKRSRTQSGDSKTKKKTRRRRKSSNDISLEIASRAGAFANGSVSEKDIHEEWMELLKAMEESTPLGSEEQPPSSETVVPASSPTASASEGDPSSSLTTVSEGYPSSSTATALEGDPRSSTAVPVEGIPPAAPDNQEASLGVSNTSSSSTLISEVDNLSDMPSILRVYSLRDEEGGGQESTCRPNLGQSGLGSFDLDSARIVEEPGTSAQVYPFATAALTSAARRIHDTTNLASSLPSYPDAQSMNRKRHSSYTYGPEDGVLPSKAPATVVNGPTFKEILNTPLQQSQTNTNSSFTHQVSSNCPNHSGHSSGALRPIAPKNTYMINTPIISPSSLNAQGVTGATGVIAAPPVLASQPVVQVVTLQPGVQQLVQPSLLGNGNLLSLLNPLILNQQIQRRRLSASPPLCSPYPTSSISANVVSRNSLVNLNTLSGQPPVNTQWTQPTTNLQLAPVTSQYSNGLDSQTTTLFYTTQAPTRTFLPWGPQ